MNPRLLIPSLLLTAALGCSRGAPEDVLLLQGETTPASELLLERRLSHPCYFEHPGMPAEAFGELGRATADGSGGFTFELFRAQTSQGGGERACFRITSPSHPRSELRTQFFDWDVRLPPLSSWNRAPVQTEAGWTISEVPTLPVGSLSTYRAIEWQLDSASGPLWRAVAPEAFVPPAEVFEDFSSPSLSAVARGEFMHYDDSLGLFWATYTEANVSTQSQSTPVTGPAPVLPLSRGATCLADDEALVFCGLTDGALERSALVGWNDGVRTVELRWSQARPLRTLLLRGLEGFWAELRIEVAEGEGEWIHVASLMPVPLGEEPDAWGSEQLKTPGRWELIPLGGVRGDRLRLVSGEAGHLLGARELSIFE